MKSRALIVAALLVASAKAQAPEPLSVIDHKCNHGRLSSIDVQVEALPSPREFRIHIDQSVCGVTT